MSDNFDFPHRRTPQQQVESGINAVIQGVLDACLKKVDWLIEKGYIEEVMSEEEIMGYISNYLDQEQHNLLDFLGDEGKVFIAMNSAEKFGDIVASRLGISEEKVTKSKVSTYSKMKSSGEDISEDEKQVIISSMNLCQGDKVLILEDMIDSGNTLNRMKKVLEDLGVEVRILCLIDKQNPEAEEAKKILGDKLQCIIKTANEFLIGFGMDWDERILAGIPGLYKVRSEGNTTMRFTGEEGMGKYLSMIKEIKEQRDRLLTLLDPNN